MGCRRSPFLNMGTTLAVVQSIGIAPCFIEAWKNSVNMGVNSSASVLSNLVDRTVCGLVRLLCVL